MAPTTFTPIITPSEPELETPIDYELRRVIGTNIDYSQLVEYHLNPDDPMVEMMGIVDKLNTLNEAIPRSVSISLALAGKTLATEFDLVSRPLLDANAALQGSVRALQRQMQDVNERLAGLQQLEQLEQLQYLAKLDLLDRPDSSKPLAHGLLYTTVAAAVATMGMVGWQIQSVRSVGNNLAWIDTSEGKLAAQIARQNPQLKTNCRKLNRAELAKLPENSANKQVCTVYLK
ncbi:MAG: hypothetical protein LH474_06535 [Chamaesiphon sp.]|nr:hypothetical protein [Chamaesiphon sp.]